MSECEICGRDTPVSIKAKIEESILNVCEKCVQFGEKVITQPETPKNTKQQPQRELKEIVLIENYGSVIKSAREKMNINRSEFAQKIKEKENIIKRVEMKELMPNDVLLTKIESFLKINLREKDVTKTQKKEVKNADLTVGDVVEVK